MGGIGLGTSSTRSLNQNQSMNLGVDREKVNLQILDGKFKMPKGQALQRSQSGLGFAPGPSFVEEEPKPNSNRSNLVGRTPTDQLRGDTDNKEADSLPT